MLQKARALGDSVFVVASRGKMARYSFSFSAQIAWPVSSVANDTGFPESAVMRRIRSITSFATPRSPSNSSTLPVSSSM